MFKFIYNIQHIANEIPKIRDDISQIKIDIKQIKIDIYEIKSHLRISDREIEELRRKIT